MDVCLFTGKENKVEQECLLASSYQSLAVALAGWYFWSMDLPFS